MPTPKWTSETAPRTGGKAGRTWRCKTMRTNAKLIAAGKEITPLDVLKGFAADTELDESLRIAAANAAAKYVHRAKAPLPPEPSAAPSSAPQVMVYIPSNNRDTPPAKEAEDMADE